MQKELGVLQWWSIFGVIKLCWIDKVIVKMANHDGNHGYLVEKNAPISLILPSRGQDGSESLGIKDHKLSMQEHCQPQ